MAITTMRTFVDNLEAVSISGVTRLYSKGPPTQTNTPDLPASFVKLPRSGDGPMVFQNQGGWPTLRATLVIVVEPVAQNLQGVNFDAAVTLIDAIHTGMRAVTCGTLGKAEFTWDIRQGIETVAGVEYWALFVDVEGRG